MYLLCWGGQLWAADNAEDKSTALVVHEEVITTETVESPQGLLGQAAELSLFGFSLLDLGTSFLIIIVTLIFRNIIVRSIFKRLRLRFERREKRHRKAILESLSKPASAFILIFGLLLAIQALPLDRTTGVLVLKIYI